MSKAPVRSPTWLLVLSLLASASAAQQPAPVRVLPSRTLVARVGAAPSELHLAAGVATVVTLDSLLGPDGLSLQAPPGLIELSRFEGGSFVLFPHGPLPQGLRLSAQLAHASQPLDFLLVSLPNEADSRVDVHVHLDAPPPPPEPSPSFVRQVLLDSRGKDVSFSTVGPQASRLEVRASVTSILRVGPRIYVSLSIVPKRSVPPPWRLGRFRLEAFFAGGTSEQLAVRFSSIPAQELLPEFHVLEATVPDGAERLFLSLEEEGAPATSRTLPFPKNLLSP